MAGLMRAVIWSNDVARRIEGQHQRPDLGAQEMIGAGSAERREARESLAADEIQHRLAVVEVADLESGRLAPWRPPRKSPRGSTGMMPAAISRRRSMVSAGVATAPNGRLPRAFLGQPVRGAIDDVERVLVAGPGAVRPGEQAMRLEHRALELGVLLREFAQLEPELVARPDPRQPANLAAEDFLGELPGIRRGGDGDQRVGMHVIDVRAVDEPMQRRVDAGGARIQVEGAMRVQRHQCCRVVVHASER